QLATPYLIVPLNNAQFVCMATSFSWTSVQNAASYSIQISEDEEFNSIKIDSSNIINTSFFIAPDEALERGTNYFWRVNSSNGIETSEWSVVWSFYTDNLFTIFPNLTSPEFGYPSTPIPTYFNWDDIYICQNWSTEGYVIQISTNPEFTNLIIDEITYTSQYNTSNLEYGTTYYWRVWAFLGSINTDWNFGVFTTESAPVSNIDIPLQSGWNLISSNVIPEEPAMESVFEGTNNIVLVKNGAGQIYSPAFGINEIGNWNVEAGYYVYTNGGSILNISGTEVNPALQGIELNAGWNLVSYLRNSSMDIQQALSSISSNLIMVKNNSGGIYHPGYGINTLGEMQPGQGYWIYISSPALLIYPEN
ncbi:MAG: hypothetical protein GX121_09070, partial [Ignavibacteria bacterium]|nr:hypothetical protein [Ignavibacteria bacterium]